MPESAIPALGEAAMGNRWTLVHPREPTGEEEMWDEHRIEVQELIDSGERVVVFQRPDGRAGPRAAPTLNACGFRSGGGIHT